MNRWFRLGVALVAVASQTACVLYPGRHGRVRVGVALPVPVIRVSIPGPPHPVPAPYESQPPQHQPQHHPQPPHRPDGGYPSAGHAPSSMQFGVVRSIEGSQVGHGRQSSLRVVVELDSRAVRVFDVAHGSGWRVGDRVRVDGAQLLRD